MERILVTGASGNVGKEILKHFRPKNDQGVYLATRDKSSKDHNKLFFDFEDIERTAITLSKVDTLFLLRPPHISNVKKYFLPIINLVKEGSVKHIVFLSVQGAENVSFIPHAKIEKLIVESGINYTFIRPSYFMQNLTSSLLEDIKEKNRILLPAKNAPFLWVDVQDIGKAIAAILTDVKPHINKAYTLTGNELLNFNEVTKLLSVELDLKIDFISPNILRFFLTKRKEGMKPAFILVMIMLHFLPRFQKEPQISGDYFSITGENPTGLLAFIKRERKIFYEDAC